MIKKILAILVVFFLTVSFSIAGEQSKKGKFAGFWGKLRRMIESVTPKKKLAVTTAVGGIRGEKNAAGADLYWKDESKAVEVSEKELFDFSTAVQAASEGNSERAIELFNNFIKDHPESSFVKEANEALKMLQEEEQPPEESS